MENTTSNIYHQYLASSHYTDATTRRSKKFQDRFSHFNTFTSMWDTYTRTLYDGIDRAMHSVAREKNYLARAAEKSGRSEKSERKGASNNCESSDTHVSHNMICMFVVMRQVDVDIRFSATMVSQHVDSRSRLSLVDVSRRRRSVVVGNWTQYTNRKCCWPTHSYISMTQMNWELSHWQTK